MLTFYTILSFYLFSGKRAFVHSVSCELQLDGSQFSIATQVPLAVFLMRGETQKDSFNEKQYFLSQLRPLKESVSRDNLQKSAFPAEN